MPSTKPPHSPGQMTPGIPAGLAIAIYALGSATLLAVGWLNALADQSAVETDITPGSLLVDDMSSILAVEQN